MFRYLMDNGVTAADYDWFMQRGSHAKRHCIMGNDYYWTNEHLVGSTDGEITPSGEIFGYYVITKQYFDRYRRAASRSARRAVPSWTNRSTLNPSCATNCCDANFTEVCVGARTGCCCEKRGVVSVNKAAPLIRRLKMNFILS